MPIKSRGLHELVTKSGLLRFLVDYLHFLIFAILCYEIENKEIKVLFKITSKLVCIVKQSISHT